VDKEILELLEKNAIVESFLTPDSFVSNIFLVPKRGRTQAGDKFKGTELVFEISTFQQ